jgi:enoyl-CoA hydratase
MSYCLIERLEDNIAIVTLNRPEKRNAFNFEFLQELEKTFRSLAADSEVRLLILTGAGETVFSSGVDLNELIRFETIEQARTFAIQLENTNEALLAFPKPVIAALNGHALGGGYGLASNADIRLMVPEAKIGFPAVRLGAILPVGCTLRLNALIGSGRSRELLLSGRVVDAQEARSIGLINEIVSGEHLMERALNLGRSILQGSDQALSMTKQLVNQELLVHIKQYGLTASENFAYLSFTEEWKRRIRDFIAEKGNK